MARIVTDEPVALATFAIAVAVFLSCGGNHAKESCETDATTKGAAAAFIVCPMCTGINSMADFAARSSSPYSNGMSRTSAPPQHSAAPIKTL